jgi:lipoprotein NlpD
MSLNFPGHRRKMSTACVLWLVLLLAGCGSTRTPAPVSERNATVTKPAPVTVPKGAVREQDPRPEFYTVKKGDTLYMIALDHGLDYKELAEWNSIDNPNVILLGQQLRLRAPVSTVIATPLKSSPSVEGKPVASGVTPPVAGTTAGELVKTQPKAVKLPYSDQALAALSGAQGKPASPPPGKAEASAASDEDDERVDWNWPAGGKLLSTFNESTNLKGIGIAGTAGQPIFASAPGKVLYSGDGIRGYGKLVIIKHNKVYLSVYAHNSQLLVKEGQTIIKGQKIAEMGSTDSDAVKLHFEIRRFGKPVDPLKLLPTNRPA